jgi:hypothetical protein
VPEPKQKLTRELPAVQDPAAEESCGAPLPERRPSRTGGVLWRGPGRRQNPRKTVARTEDQWRQEKSFGDNKSAQTRGRTNSRSAGPVLPKVQDGKPPAQTKTDAKCTLLSSDNTQQKKSRGN